MIGVVVLLAVLAISVPLLAHWAANADPRVLARVVRIAAFVAIGFAGVLLLLGLGRGGLAAAPFLLPLALGLYLQWRRRRNMFKTAHGPTPGQGSAVKSRYLDMRLDHDSGAMSGRITDGPHRGARLDELSLEALLDLLRFYTGADPRSAQLLEAWLDREGPEDWRDGASEEAPADRSQGMSRAEAYEVLGLKPGAAAADIRAAHRRLMREYHPDRGGSTFFAAQINQAKDILLGS